jgi:hypothetical protein
VLGPVVGVVAGAVVLGTAPAGAAVVAAPTGAVVVGAEAGGTVAEVPGARGARAADRPASPTTTPTDVLAPGGGRLPSRLASGRPAAASTAVTAPTASANTTAAATAARGYRRPRPADRPGRRRGCLGLGGRPAEQRAPQPAVGGRQPVGVPGGGHGHEDAQHARAGQGAEDPEQGGEDGAADRRERAAQQVGNA